MFQSLGGWELVLLEVAGKRQDGVWSWWSWSLPRCLLANSADTGLTARHCSGRSIGPSCRAEKQVAEACRTFKRQCRGFARDPYRSLALHFNVGVAEEVHEGLDATGLRYSHSGPHRLAASIHQGSLCVACVAGS